jgi:hypothetical protein
MADRQFGVGNATKEKAFATATLGRGEHARIVELIFGEHPHSYSENNIYARYTDGRIEEFDGHRIQVKIELETYNYLKESELSGDEIRKGGEGKIYLNGEPTDSWFFRDIEHALDGAKHRLATIMDHPLRLWDKTERAKVVGRKVYYQNTPAVVRHFFADQGCVVLAPADGYSFPVPAYAIEDARESGGTAEREEDTAKIEITSPEIWWWRK